MMTLTILWDNHLGEVVENSGLVNHKEGHHKIQFMLGVLIYSLEEIQLLLKYIHQIEEIPMKCISEILGLDKVLKTGIEFGIVGI